MTGTTRRRSMRSSCSDLRKPDLTRMLKTTHVRVLDRALLQSRPVSPNFVKNVGSSLLAGLLLGLAAAFIVSRLDRTVRSLDR